MEFVIIGAFIYIVVAVGLARRTALNILDQMHYPPYAPVDYAEAGVWGALVGLLWPLLGVAVSVGAIVGWLLTRHSG